MSHIVGTKVRGDHSHLTEAGIQASVRIISSDQKILSGTSDNDDPAIGLQCQITDRNHIPKFRGQSPEVAEANIRRSVDIEAGKTEMTQKLTGFNHLPIGLHGECRRAGKREFMKQTHLCERGIQLAGAQKHSRFQCLDAAEYRC